MSIALPGYVPDVHTADALDPAWGNAIRDRAAQIFDTTTNRDAAITVPQVGQSCVLTTLSNAGEYFYVGATDGWRPAWNSGWGIVGFAQITADVTGVSTLADVAGLSVTFTAVANRNYAITVSFGGGQQVTSTGTSAVIVTDGANTRVGLVQQYVAQIATTTLQAATRRLIVSGVAAGAVTYKARATTSAGTFTLHADSGATYGPATIVVEDLGPNGAPA